MGANPYRLVIVDGRGRKVGECDRSVGSSLFDVLVALRSELAPRTPEGSVLYLDSEPLSPETTIEHLAQRIGAPEGGRIHLVVKGEGGEGSGEESSRDTEVMNLVDQADTIPIWQRPTQLVIRLDDPELEPGAGGAVPSPDNGHPSGAETELIDRRRAGMEPETKTRGQGRAAVEDDVGVDDLGDYGEEKEPKDATGIHHRPRMLRARYVRTMAREEVYTFEVELANDEREKTAQLTLRPAFTGCLVTPIEAPIGGDRPGRSARFWVTPLSRPGPGNGGIDVYLQGARIASSHWPTRIEEGRSGPAGLVLAFLVGLGVLGTVVLDLSGTRRSLGIAGLVLAACLALSGWGRRLLAAKRMGQAVEVDLPIPPQGAVESTPPRP